MLGPGRVARYDIQCGPARVAGASWETCMTTVLVIIIILLLLGVGYGGYSGRYHGTTADPTWRIGGGIGVILVVILILVLLGVFNSAVPPTTTAPTTGTTTTQPR
jgi:uncharacterized integral membrane protein